MIDILACKPGRSYKHLGTLDGNKLRDEGLKGKTVIVESIDVKSRGDGTPPIRVIEPISKTQCYLWAVDLEELPQTVTSSLIDVKTVLGEDPIGKESLMLDILEIVATWLETFDGYKGNSRVSYGMLFVKMRGGDLYIFDFKEKYPAINAMKILKDKINLATNV